VIRFFRPIRPLLYGWVLAFGGWALVAFVLGLNFVRDTGVPWTHALHAAIRDQLPWAVLTPLIFRFATRHLIDHANWKKNLALHLAICMVVIWGIHQWKIFIDPAGPGLHRPPRISAKDLDPSAPRPVLPPPPGWDFFHFASVEIPIYLMIISAAHTLHFYQRAEMRSGQLARARLQALQMQIQPHFLFNTLNTIAGMARLESVLPSAGFMRVSRSAIVRLSRVKEIQTTRKGHHFAVMHSGMRVCVTKSIREVAARLR